MKALVVEKENLNEVKIESFNATNIKDDPNLLLKVNLGPCNKIYKTDLIKNNGIKFEESLKYEDTLFIVKTIYNAKKVVKLNKFLHYYMIHEKSETTVRDERVFDILKIVDKIRKYLKNDKSIKETVDKLTVQILTNYTIQQRYQSDKSIAMKFIDDTFKYLKKEPYSSASSICQ